MKNKIILDKDGVHFTSAEIAEYENDVWNLRLYDYNSSSKKAANIKMWDKWGKRLGLPRPNSE